MMVAFRYCRKCGTGLPANSQFCPSCGTSQRETAHDATYQSLPQQSLQEMHTGRIPTGSMLHARYRLLHTIGQGGMGAVYVAQDTQLGDRLVAVKEMSMSRLAPQEIAYAVERFKQEAHILASLHHPNLPAIYDHFSEKDRWYLVMSFIQGETLHAHVQAATDHKLPVKEVVHIGIELCNVLDYLHTHQPQIIFRDLKPLNIMITPKGQLYLIDFGIARHFKQEQAQDTASYYSVGYAPPEQYGQSQTGPRSDIYSLGATLHQLLTGHNPAGRPFNFAALQQVDPSIPASLAALIAHMLELNEQQRPASMMEVKAELEKALDPPATVPPTQAAQASAAPAAIAPTQSAQPDPTPAAVASSESSTLPPPPVPATAKPTSIRAFGGRQFVTMLVLATCYGIITYIDVLWLIQNTENIYARFIEIGLLYLFPIFFASFFGLWEGFGAASIAFLSTYFIGWRLLFPWASLPNYNEAIYPWWIGAFCILSALPAGLIWLKTKGQYHKFTNILFPWLSGLLCIFLLESIYQIINHDYYYHLSSILLTLLPTFVFLPLLLSLSNKIRSSQTRQNASKHV